MVMSSPVQPHRAVQTKVIVHVLVVVPVRVEIVADKDGTEENDDGSCVTT